LQPTKRSTTTVRAISKAPLLLTRDSATTSQRFKKVLITKCQSCKTGQSFGLRRAFTISWETSPKSTFSLHPKERTWEKARRLYLYRKDHTSSIPQDPRSTRNVLFWPSISIITL